MPKLVFTDLRNLKVRLDCNLEYKSELFNSVLIFYRNSRLYMPGTNTPTIEDYKSMMDIKINDNVIGLTKEEIDNDRLPISPDTVIEVGYNPTNIEYNFNYVINSSIDSFSQELSLHYSETIERFRNTRNLIDNTLMMNESSSIRYTGTSMLIVTGNGGRALTESTSNNILRTTNTVNTTVLSEESYEKLERVIYQDDYVMDSTLCTVCQDDFIDGDEMVKLGCNHYFHDDCASGWLTVMNNTCPLCRKVVGTEDDHTNLQKEETYENNLDDMD